MKRSLLVQTLLDMATGSGGTKLEALVVDTAGIFDAGSRKGYNPVTVPSGSINVIGEKGIVSNNSMVITPKAQVVGGWVNSGETAGSGVEVTAGELVSGTLSVSSAGETDVTNYQKVSVSSGSATPSANKGTASNHVIQVTPIVTKTAGIITAGSEQGTPVSVAANELVSGTLNVSSSGTYDVTNYQSVEVSIDAYKIIKSGQVAGDDSASIQFTFSDLAQLNDIGGVIVRRRAATSTSSVSFELGFDILNSFFGGSKLNTFYDTRCFNYVRNTATTITVNLVMSQAYFIGTYECVVLAK